MKLGQKMLSEMQFYEIDEHELGSESEDFEGDGDDDQDKNFAAILKKKQEAEDGEKEPSPMEAAFRMMDADNRMDEMQ